MVRVSKNACCNTHFRTIRPSDYGHTIAATCSGGGEAVVCWNELEVDVETDAGKEVMIGIDVLDDLRQHCTHLRLHLMLKHSTYAPPHTRVSTS